MSRVLVDSNVLLDVLTDDPQWGAWSAAQLNAVAAQGELAVNPIIYAEVSVGFERIEYHIYVLKKIRQGEAALDRGEGLSQEEVERRLARWLKP